MTDDTTDPEYVTGAVLAQLEDLPPDASVAVLADVLGQKLHADHVVVVAGPEAPLSSYLDALQPHATDQTTANLVEMLRDLLELGEERLAEERLGDEPKVDRSSPEAYRASLVALTEEQEAVYMGTARALNTSFNEAAVELRLDQDRERWARAMKRVIADIGHGFHLDTRGADYTPPVADPAAIDRLCEEAHTLFRDPYAVVLAMMTDIPRKRRKGR